MAAWSGRGGVIETTSLIGESEDPDGDMASQRGWTDGQQLGRLTKMNHDLKQKVDNGE